MSSLIGALHPVPPYDFALNARASGYYTTLGQWRDGVYRRALRVGEQTVLVDIQPTGTPSAPALDIHLVAADGSVEPEAVLKTVSRLLNLDPGLTPFYVQAQSVPRLWRLVEPLHGLTIFQTGNVFEAMALTVMEQQISLAAAQRAERWLIEWAEEGIEHEGVWYPTFPSPTRLALATVDDLIPLKITFRRMQTLIDLARLDVDSSFERLRDMPPTDAYHTLVALNGIGHWTAAWTLTRGLGQFLYVGSADVALRAAVNHYFYDATGRATTEATDDLFAGFGAHAGLASFYTLMKWALDRYPREG